LGSGRSVLEQHFALTGPFEDTAVDRAPTSLTGVRPSQRPSGQRRHPASNRGPYPPGRAFGGEILDRLFITTSARDVDRAEQRLWRDDLQAGALSAAFTG
jgi:hypothetical protein